MVIYSEFAQKRGWGFEDAIGLPPNQSATLRVAQKLHLTIESEQVSVS